MRFAGKMADKQKYTRGNWGEKHATAGRMFLRGVQTGEEK